MHFYQTKSIHPTRSWTLDFGVLARLPVLLILWSTCCMLTGCNTPSALTPYQLTPSAPATPAYMVNLHDLQLEYKQETFKQFFIERQAEAIWNRLRLCLAPAGIFGGIDETSIDQDTQISELLAGYIKPMQEELQAAIRLYIGHQKQLYLLSIQGITQEIAFRKLLLSNELPEVWDRLQSAKNNLQDAVDLSGMLQGLPEIVQIHVLEKLIPWINKHLHVIALDLSGNSLTMLPESMGGLSNLRQLNLSYNNLTLLPDSIGNLGNLRSLVIKGNLLTLLPDSMGNLSKLRELNLFRNNLTELPDSMKNLSSLRALNLFRNNLTELPACIGNLSNLRQLNVSTNGLNLLPAFIGNLSKLRTLNVSGNNLTELPACIGNLSNLSQLDLFYNHLTELPACIGKLSNLRWLDVSSNKLNLLPAFIGNLTNLGWLDVSSNELNLLPAFIGNLTNLYALYIGDNQLTVLPGSLQKLPMLSQFSAYYNHLLKPLSRKGIGVLLTSSNLATFLFPSLTELTALYIAQNQISYIQGNCTLPPDCISRIENPKTYPVILFTTQLGDVALLQPIPITTNLSYKQILDQVHSGRDIILIQQA